MDEKQKMSVGARIRFPAGGAESKEAEQYQRVLLYLILFSYLAA